MSLSVELLQELPPTEEAELNAVACCWNSAISCWIASISVTSCHSCTNTG